jgi:hypothetical protein
MTAIPSGHLKQSFLVGNPDESYISTSFLVTTLFLVLRPFIGLLQVQSLAVGSYADDS